MTGTPASTADCVFCDAAAAPLDSTLPQHQLIVGQGRLAFVILNLFPYNNGHLMVVPRRHVGSLAALTTEELNEVMALTRDSEVALNEAYQPQGINAGINLGRSAGAGIVDHVHVHLVPRWTGDTNFMSVVGNTRVLPEDMSQTAARLRPIFERIVSERRP